MKDKSTPSEKFSWKGISKALRALPNFLKFYILSGGFWTLKLINEFLNNFMSKTYQLKELFNVDVENSV